MERATKTDPIRQPAPWRYPALLAGLIAFFTLVRLIVVDRSLLSGDEAYYWLWSRQLQLSYFDHPGMAAWWMALSTWIGGDSELAVRLPSILGAAGVSVLVYDITRRAFDSPAGGVVAVIWLNATVLFGAAAVTATPDTPLLVFWTLALWAMVRLMREGRARWLYVLAIALGLGFLGKYTMVLIIPGLLAGFVLFRSGRRWFGGGDLPLAAVVALICAAPVLVWNYRHDWVSFRKQLTHSFDVPVADSWASVGTFAGTQIGLVTPLIFGFCLWGIGWSIWAGWRRGRADWFILGACPALMLLFFLHHAIDGLVQPHWAGPAWIGAIIAATGAWMSHRARPRPKRPPGSGRWGRIAFIAAPLVAVAMVAAVYLHMATAILPIPPKLDPIGRLGGWDGLAQAVEQQRVRHPGAFVLAQKHEISGLLTYYLPGHPVVFLTGSNGIPRIPSYRRDDLAALPGRDGLFITRNGAQAVADVGRYFDRIIRVDTVERRWGGRVVDRYEIWLGEQYRPGLFDDWGNQT